MQSTADRLNAVSGEPDRLLVVTANDYRSLVLDQLPELSVENLLIEPIGRDTAAAILYAALVIHREDPKAVMGIFPADHRISDNNVFENTIKRAIEYAQINDALVTLGIVPDYPATGYGYIEQGDTIGRDLHKVKRFVEKPNEEAARGLLASGKYLWNSGMFLWTAETIIKSFEQFVPELYQSMSSAFGIRGELKRVYPSLPKVSVDYAILERAQNMVVLTSSFGWDDLGDWNALERLLKGEGQNVTVGRHIGLDTDGAILYTTEGESLIATIGLDDVVVVRSGDVTLVVRKDRTQDIKKVVQRLKNTPGFEKFA